MQNLRIWLARRCIRRAAYHARHLSDGELRALLEEQLHERAAWVAT
jgi:hypothetical protein